MVVKIGYFDLLYNLGMSVDVRDADKKTPLHLAAYNRMTDCVQLLLHCGAKVDALTRFRSTPLHYASFVGSIGCAQLLLQYGADIDAKESWGQSPLMIAVKQGNLEFVKYLLTQGPHLESVDHLDQQTALHVACCGRDVDIVRCLLNAGCIINPLDKNNSTPLQLAIRRNFKDAVFLLLNYGACHDNIQNLKDQMPHRLPLIALVEQTQGELLKVTVINHHNNPLHISYYIFIIKTIVSIQVNVLYPYRCSSELKATMYDQTSWTVCVRCY